MNTPITVTEHLEQMDAFIHDLEQRHRRLKEFLAPVANKLVEQQHGIETLKAQLDKEQRP